MFRPVQPALLQDLLDACLAYYQQNFDPTAASWEPVSDWQGNLYVKLPEGFPSSKDDVQALPVKPKAIRHFVPIAGDVAGRPYVMEGTLAPQGSYAWGDNLANITAMLSGVQVDAAAVTQYSQETGYSTPPPAPLAYVVALSTVRKPTNGLKTVFFEVAFTDEQLAFLQNKYHGHEGGGVLSTREELVKMEAALSASGYDTTLITNYLQP